MGCNTLGYVIHLHNAGWSTHKVIKRGLTLKDSSKIIYGMYFIRVSLSLRLPLTDVNVSVCPS